MHKFITQLAFYETDWFPSVILAPDQVQTLAAAVDALSCATDGPGLRVTFQDQMAHKPDYLPPGKQKNARENAIDFHEVCCGEE